jgi:thioredoxin 2
MSDTIIVVCPHCHAPNRLPRHRLSEDGRCGQCKQALFTRSPLALDSISFDRHVGRSELPVVVDFWAPWCGPCRMMAPTFEQAASELEPQYRLAKVNTEAHPELGARFNIRSIPTLVMFQNGREIARQSGALDKSSLVRWIRTPR